MFYSCQENDLVLHYFAIFIELAQEIWKRVMTRVKTASALLQKGLQNQGDVSESSFNSAVVLEELQQQGLQASFTCQ